MCYLLRPEVVKHSPLHLSSDALLNFGNEATEKNKRVQAATHNLLENIIPSTCRELERRKTIPRIGSLAANLKMRGINMR